jgi:hypothetical protein
MDNKKYIISLFISIIFLILLTFPVIQMFNLNKLILGIPALLLYILSLWVVMIVLLIWLTRRTKNDLP